MPKRDRSAKDQAYEQIKARVLDLRLRPGARVDDIALAAELGLSRTPVREALFHLGSDGLVRVGDRGGFTVQSLDLLEVRELFEAHMVLAKSVARLLTSRVTDAEIAHLQAATDAVDRAIADDDPGRIAQTNADLHLAEARYARNGYLEFLAARIHLQSQRLAFLTFGGEGKDDTRIAEFNRQACADHAETLVALRERDADRAETVATRHVRQFRERINSFLAVTSFDEMAVTFIPTDAAARSR
ncbi:GntR family transcriptional regulator [Rhodococcoides kroppenstedtii]|uniref:GntR family transcriptional regulator n=1 Tax=Rhodococcoides kroppenstedtii TaxID=293050 RepID=UPI00362F07DD